MVVDVKEQQVLKSLNDRRDYRYVMSISIVYLLWVTKVIVYWFFKMSYSNLMYLWEILLYSTPCHTCLYNLLTYQFYIKRRGYRSGTGPSCFTAKGPTTL